MPKRVFISYSTLQLPANQPTPDVVASRDVLTVRLRAAGYEPLVDRELRAGERWRHQIYRWIALCDAAVVLLSRAALKAPWVRKEVELLMWRWELAGKKSPLILPFRLGDVQPNEASLEEFSATFINELQAPALEGDALADAVLERLQALPGPGLENPLRDIERSMAAQLTNLSERDLDDTLGRLNVAPLLFAPEVPDPVEQKRDALAAALLDVDLRQLQAFLERKAPNLKAPGAAELLVDWVASFCVDEAHGVAVFRRARGNRREIAITSQFPKLGRHYVARGHLTPVPPKVVTPVLRSDEELDEESGIDAVVDKIAHALEPDESLSRKQLKKILKRDAERSGMPRFVALQVPADHRALRARLQEEFEGVAFLFFTRNDDGVVALDEITTIAVDSECDENFETDYLSALRVARP